MYLVKKKLLKSVREAPTLRNQKNKNKINPKEPEEKKFRDKSRNK